MINKVESDVLVVGTGGAGLRAAIEADEQGSDVVVLSKAPAGMNNATVVAGGGFRVALEGLTPEEHYQDTIRTGYGINDRRLVKIFTQEGGERVLELRRFGVEMKIHPSSVSVGDTPSLRGLGITKPMVEYLRSREVKIFENVILTKLLKEEGAIVGAVGYDLNNAQPVTFQVKAVILATGGAGALYKRTDCPLRTTGDGYSLAYHAGAWLRDMEFIQFFPVALSESGAPPFLMGGPITEEGRIINRLGEDITIKHGVTARPFVLKSRGPLSIAIMREILDGNGVEEAVLLDATKVFKQYGEEDLPIIGRYSYFKDKLRADKKPLKISPICHFCMGGIVSGADGDTGVSGLYAAGEVVGGVHGANRHGGNALTDITVFGARAGKAASEYVRDRTSINVDSMSRSEIEIYDKIRKKDGYNKPKDLMNELRELMWFKAGIVREKKWLEDALNGVNELREKQKDVSIKTTREMLVALELPMAFDSAEMIIRAALKREESRGAHFRKEYPRENSEWMKIVVIHKGDNEEMVLSTRPI